MSAFVEIIFDNTDNRIPVSVCTKKLRVVAMGHVSIAN